METDNNPNLNDLIVKAKGSRTLRQFAEIIGVNASTISRISSGKIRLSDELIQKIVENAEIPGSITPDMFYSLAPKDEPQLNRNRFEEIRSSTYLLVSVLVTDIMNRGYTLYSTSDVQNSRFDLTLRTDALGRDAKTWGFEMLHPIQSSTAGKNKRFNDGMFFSPLWRCAASLYLGQACLDRFSLVTCDEDFFSWILDKTKGMTPLGEVSLILVDSVKKKVAQEFILPPMDGHDPSTPFQ